MTIQEAKARVDIPAIAAIIFPKWNPEVSCKCPWREDRNPSFSVFDNGRKWKDHGTGDSGDAVDFLEKAKGLSKEEAIQQFLQMAGIPNERTHQGNFVRSGVEDTPAKESTRSKWPSFDYPSEEEQEAIASLRNLPREGLRWAAVDGILKVSNMDGHRSWIIRSGCGRHAQARRLDGGKFELCGQQLKAKTLAGSIASIPIGRFFDVRWPLVVLVEGGPDVLAAYAAIHKLGLLDVVAVCGILGAGLKLPTSSAATLRNRKTRILQHNDKAGDEAADRWAQQIWDAGGKVDIWVPDQAGADLNDVFGLPPNEADAAIREAFSFAKEGR